MEFAILTYAKRPMSSKGKNRLNIGDPIQTYAMRHIYSIMEINENDMIEISRYHAKNYDGEYALLPYNCFNRIYNQLGHPYGSLPLSAKIVPVFISFHLHSRYLDESIQNNLRAYQPIGCRDEETLMNMREHGITAYLSGCVTALLPKRQNKPKIPKTFFVDIPQSLMKYIPQGLMENSEFIEHQINFLRSSDSEFMTDEEYERFYTAGVKQLEKYKEEATLVVTSRLHAATPCMAMGIPVILVSDNFDGRFSWIDKFLPLYTPDRFDDIDWAPCVVNYEADKLTMTNIFINQIENAYKMNKDIYHVSSYYENRNRYKYNAGLIDALNKLPFSNKTGIKYAIWGLVTLAQTIKNVITDEKEWELVIFIDNAVDGKFEGVDIAKSENIKQLDKDIIYFVIPESAHNNASKLLTRLGRKFVLVNKTNMKFHQ